MNSFKDIFDEDILSLPEEVSKYTTKITAPIYEPKNIKPYIHELYTLEKTNLLLAEIMNAESLSEDEKLFLINAACRHTVFNYEKIADYYAHSNTTMKELMEKSALVIIDFNKAIENGFIMLSEELSAQYRVDNG